VSLTVIFAPSVIETHVYVYQVHKGKAGQTRGASGTCIRRNAQSLKGRLKMVKEPMRSPLRKRQCQGSRAFLTKQNKESAMRGRSAFDRRMKQRFSSRPFVIQSQILNRLCFVIGNGNGITKSKDTTALIGVPCIVVGVSHFCSL